MTRNDSDWAAIHPTAMIDAGVSIDPTARVGAFAYIGGACRIECGVVVDARATIVGRASDADAPETTVIGEHATIGAGAILSGPITIGVGAVVEAGAVVVDDVPAHAVVAGNPAAVVGYTKPDESVSAAIVAPPERPGERVEVAGCQLIRLPRVDDLRGALTFAEVDDDLPFTPRRIFVVYDVPNQKIRGSHAHYELHEFIMALGGSVTVTVDNGKERGQIVLDDPTLALHLRPLTWTTQYAFSTGAFLVVLASHVYEDADYIRDYRQYREVVDA